MPKVILVQGLGFGDEGKGTMTEFLAKDNKASLVVRFNGGAQAAHNIVTPDGKHHTFSQWGSATLIGANTALSKHVLIDPIAMLPEAAHLQTLGVSDPWEMLRVDPNCPVITPYHRYMNRIREDARGYSRHGSTGVGIGECMSDLLKYGRENVPVAADLKHREVLRKKLKFIQEVQLRKLKEIVDPISLARVGFSSLEQDPDEVVLRYDLVSNFLGVEPTLDILEEVIHRAGKNVVFEGAQGVLLHEYYGFHPHTTWSDTTFKNANELLKSAGFGADIEVERVGVVRTYMTRHGAGPLPTEFSAGNHNSHDHNGFSRYTGSMRVGYFDIPLIAYALDVIGDIDSLAVTHLDKQLQYINAGYIPRNRDDATFIKPDGKIFKQSNSPLINESYFFEQQEKIGAAVGRAIPLLSTMDIDEAVERLNVDFKYASYGNTLKDKESV